MIDPRSIPRHFALFSFLQQRPKHNDRRFTMKITPLQMYKLANRRFIHRKSRWKYSRMGLRQFASFFGCTPAVAAALWNRIEKKKDEIDVDPNFTPAKLLWTLLFLKTYLSETVLATLCRGCTEKTLRKWVWIGIDILGDLDLVCGCAVSCRVGQCPVAHSHSMFFSYSSADQVEEQVHERQWKSLLGNCGWYRLQDQ